MSHLLQPDLIRAIPFTGNRIAEHLELQSAELAERFEDSPWPEPDITVAIRTLNEAERLETLFEGIEAQDYGGDVEVIVVDNESSDGTADVARSFGATVVNLARNDFTYPRSMNMCLEAASLGTVFLTVGHAALSNRLAFRSGVSHFASESTGGVFARTLPNDNASLPERLTAIGNVAFVKPPHAVKKASLGVMASQNAFYSRQLWKELGKFDESYQIGGEDTAFAAEMKAKGFDIVEDPLVAVHHTHGLGLINTIRQWKTWMATVGSPQELDMDKLARRRPDIDFS